MIEVEIYNGLGDFNISGTKDCTIFEFRGRSKFMIWEMEGNLLMNHIIGRIPKKTVLHFEAYLGLKEKLEIGCTSLMELEPNLTSLLQSFTDGRYKLETIKLDDFHTVFLPGVFNGYGVAEDLSKSVWLGDPVVYAIQEPTNEKSIHYYEQMIKRGARPQIIFFKSNKSEIQLIIEGQNKLKAYNLCRVSPRCIQITKLDNYEIGKYFILNAFDKLEDNESLRKLLLEHLKEVKGK